jgi:hypothetical protein
MRLEICFLASSESRYQAGSLIISGKRPVLYAFILLLGQGQAVERSNFGMF